MSVIPDSEFADRVRTRLRTETVLRLTASAADCDQDEAYLPKYARDVERVSGDPADFAKRCSVPLRIGITGVRGF